VTLRAGHPLTGTSLAENQLAALASGQQATTTLSAAVASLPPTEPTVLWVVIDDAGVVAESDESNNTRSGSFASLPDLAVTGQDIAAGSGQLLVTVHNRGQLPSTPVAVWIGAGSARPTATSAFHKATVDAIAPGGQRVLSVPIAPGSGLFAVLVDGDNALAENDEANNLAFRRLQVVELIYLSVLTR